MKNEDVTKELNKIVEFRQKILESRYSGLPDDLQQILLEVFDNMPNGITVQDLNHRILYVNSTVEKQTGYSRLELFGKHPAILIGEDNVDQSIQEILNTINHNKNWCNEFSTKCKDGSTFLSEVEVFPIVRNGVPIAWGTIQRDITKRKQAETSLRLSEERFYKVFNNSPLPVSINSFPDMRFLYVNDSMVKFNGYQREDCIGRTPQELNLWVNQEDLAKFNRMFKEQGFIKDQEVFSRMKSGELRLGLFSADVMNLDNQQCILNVVTDITDRKKFEKEIFRLDRLNLIGEMAAGIGHEVRNPMTTVRGFLQILGAKKDCYQYKEYFDLMIDELDRANSIITEFLSLAKNKAVEYRIKNINTIVEALLPLLQSDAMKDDKFIKVELSNTQDLSLNEKEIRQLVLNLVRNGLEAMSPKGNLTIRTFMDNEAVILSVQDQGNGIETDVLEKLGIPFFTTKENGTGLGLAVCYSIASRHNAKIGIESNATGTTFFVRFNQTKQSAGEFKIA